MDWEKVGLDWLAESIRVLLLEPHAKMGQKYAFACFALDKGMSFADMRQFVYDWEEAKEDASSE